MLHFCRAPRDLAFVQAHIREKDILLTDKCDNHAAFFFFFFTGDIKIWLTDWLYYIVSLAKFGNCCSMTWARRQGQWKGKYFHFGEGGKKSYALFYNVFSDLIFYPRILQKFRVSKTIPASVGLSPMSCFSDDLAQLLPCLDRPVGSKFEMVWPYCSAKRAHNVPGHAPPPFSSPARK